MERSILVIEDDPDIAKLVQLHLQDAKYEVTVIDDGEQGFELARDHRFNLIILDLMLPGLDGLEICRRLRGQENRTPILMLTARATELERILGLEIGADDYLTKPFSILELVARVKAIFRRAETLNTNAPEQKIQIIRTKSFVIDLAQHTVTRDGQPIPLTAKEFDLFMYLAKNPGRVYRRPQLLDEIWGYGYTGYEHTVNTHINRLRAKIEKDPSDPHYILTVRGVGYKFADLE